ncbi:serine hydrolase [Atopobium sp. oral taxon 810]|uniref:D-alanyl-D-alanine carboxypeptidase family protein n=1 Tax=Atopobium sp. oral taxon 810 TaxID=712158 RepID=UPI001E449D91|nr:serine hydrolase [Atopobium sp. oral taxon 810]
MSMSTFSKNVRVMRLLVACVLSLLMVAPASVVWASSMPQLPKDAAIYLIDNQTGDVIASQRADEKMYPASLTKMMTALVAMDYVGDKLDEKVSVGDEVKLTPEDSTIMGCHSGDVYSWRDLIYGMMLPSGSDAALVLGTHVGRLSANDSKLDPKDALAKFIALMNEKAKTMGLTGTHFNNVHGFHDKNHYSCAHDLTSIAQAVLANKFLSEVVSTQSHECVNKEDANVTVYNTNWLVDKTAGKIEKNALVDAGETGVDNPYYKAECQGVKTGYTEEAGRCLAFAGKNKKMSFVGVVLHLSDKPTIYKTTGAALESALNEYERRRWGTDVLPYTVTISNPSLQDFLNHNIKLRVRRRDTPKTVTIDATLKYETKIAWDKKYVKEGSEDTCELQSAIKSGSQIATMQVFCEGKLISETPLYVDQTMMPFSNEDKLVLAGVATGSVLLIMLIIAGIRMIVKRNKHDESQSPKEADDLAKQ